MLKYLQLNIGLSIFKCNYNSNLCLMSVSIKKTFEKEKKAISRMYKVKHTSK